MLPGPIVRHELLAYARRRQSYSRRLLYGLTLLALIATILTATLPVVITGGASPLSARGMAHQALSAFMAFSLVQMFALVACVPALVAGAIGDDVNRKTLPSLLASPLGGGEIVLGKLTARMIDVGVLVAVGVPVMGLLALLGGVDPWLVFTGFAATCSTAIFLAALSMLISVFVPDGARARGRAYGFVLLWLLVPTFIQTVPLAARLTKAVPVLAPLNAWVFPTNPFTPVWRVLLWFIGPMRVFNPGAINPSPATLATDFTTMIPYQLAFALLFIAVAAWRLRPAFLSREGRAPRVKRHGLPRPVWRPHCGTDAMFWKEVSVGGRGARWAVLLPVVVISFIEVFGGGWLRFHMGRASAEIAEFGAWSAWGPDGRARAFLNYPLRQLTGFCGGFWMLSVALAAASTISFERERGTWDGLTASPLSAWEIIRAKLLGAIWRSRIVALPILILWGIGAVLQAVHPLGAVLAAVALVICTWFASALGTFFSARSTTSAEAIARTVTTLLALGAGYLVMLALGASGPFGLIHVVSAPSLIALPLLSYRDTTNFAIRFSASGQWPWELLLIGLPLVALSGYAFAAWILTRGASERLRPSEARQPLRIQSTV